MSVAADHPDGVSARAALADVLADVRALADPSDGSEAGRLEAIRAIVDDALERESRDPDHYPDEATVIAGVRAAIAHTRGRHCYVVLPHTWAVALVTAHDHRKD